MTQSSAKVERPFPQNEIYKNISRPSTVTVDEMNKQIIEFYKGWKKEYLYETKSTKDGYILLTDGGTNAEESALTVSEGHGYGMLTVALMAGLDEDAQKIFDGFYKVFREYPSDIDKDLMSWQITGVMGESESKKLSSSATDGDFDIAYSLILADRQWGSSGKINYLAESKKVINAIDKNNIHPKHNRILLGDWVKDGDKYSIATRSSDWVMGHFRLFEEVSDDKKVWSDVRDTSYSILFQVQNQTTGLLPDFVVEEKAIPAPPHFLEDENDGHYGNNSCRDPWRLGMDRIHYNSPDSKKALTPLLNWIDSTTNSDLSKMDNGYSLDGKPLWKVDDWGTWGAFSAPVMVAATVDKKYQNLLNSGWKHNSFFSSEVGYYGNSIRLLSLLVVSGNWWNPSNI